jgi:hypothetical protein
MDAYLAIPEVAMEWNIELGYFFSFPGLHLLLVGCRGLGQLYGFYTWM